MGTHFNNAPLFFEDLNDPALLNYNIIINMLDQYQEKPYLIDAILPQTLEIITNHLVKQITTVSTELMRVITQLFNQLAGPQTTSTSPPTPSTIQLPNINSNNDLTSSLDILQRAAQIFYTLCKVRKLKFILRFLNPPPHLLDPIFLVLMVVTTPTTTNVLKAFQLNQEIDEISLSTLSDDDETTSATTLLSLTHPDTSPTSTTGSLSSNVIDSITQTFTNCLKRSDWQLSYTLLAMSSVIVLTPFPLHSFDMIASHYSPRQLTTISRTISALNNIVHGKNNQPISQLPPPPPPLHLSLLTLPLPIRIYSLLTLLLPSPSHLQLMSALALGRFFSRTDLFSSASIPSPQQQQQQQQSQHNLHINQILRPTIAQNEPPDNHTQTTQSMPSVSVSSSLHLYPSLSDLMSLVQSILYPTTSIPITSLIRFGATTSLSPNLANPPSESFPTLPSGVLIVISTLLDNIQVTPAASSVNKELPQPQSLTPSQIITSGLIPIIITTPAKYLLPQPTLPTATSPLPTIPTMATSSSQPSSQPPTTQPVNIARSISGGFGALLRSLPLENQSQCLDILTTNQKNGQLPSKLTLKNANTTPSSHSDAISTSPNTTPLWLSSQSTISSKLWVKALKRLLLVIFRQDDNSFLSPLLPLRDGICSTSSLPTPTTDTTTEITEIINSTFTTTTFNTSTSLLLDLLHDGSWGLRWAAAKGVGIVLSQLDRTKTLHLEQIQQMLATMRTASNELSVPHNPTPPPFIFPMYYSNLIQSLVTTLINQTNCAIFDQQVDSVIGNLLAISELLRLHLIPSRYLIEIVQLTLLALYFPIHQGSQGGGRSPMGSSSPSNGSTLRETACLALYTFSRGTAWPALLDAVVEYNNAQALGTSIANIILAIYDALITTALIDPEKNVRCASSAALQEFIGQFYHPFSTYPHLYRDYSAMKRPLVHGDEDNEPQQLTIPTPSSSFDTLAHYTPLISHDPFQSTFQHEIHLISTHIKSKLTTTQLITSRLFPCPVEYLNRFQLSSSSSSPPLKSPTSPLWISDFHLSALSSLSEFDYHTTIQLSPPSMILYHSFSTIRDEFNAVAKRGIPHAENSNQHHQPHQQHPFLNIFMSKLQWLLENNQQCLQSLLLFVWTRYIPAQQLSTRVFGHFALSATLLFIQQVQQTPQAPESVTNLFQTWLAICTDLTDASPTAIEVKLTIATTILSITSPLSPNQGIIDSFPRLISLPSISIGLLSAQFPDINPSGPILSPATPPSNTPQSAIKLSQQVPNWLTLRTQLLYYLIGLVRSISGGLLPVFMSDTGVIDVPQRTEVGTYLGYFLNIAIAFFYHHHTKLQSLSTALFISIDNAVQIITNNIPSESSCYYRIEPLVTIIAEWKKHLIQYLAYRTSPLLHHLAGIVDLDPTTSSHPSTISKQQIKTSIPTTLDQFFHQSLSPLSPLSHGQNTINPIPNLYQIPMIPLCEIDGLTAPLPRARLGTTTKSSILPTPTPSQLPPQQPIRQSRFKSRIPTSSAAVLASPASNFPPASLNSIPTPALLPFCANISLMTLCQSLNDIITTPADGTTTTYIPSQHLQWIQYAGLLHLVTPESIDFNTAKIIIQQQTAQRHQNPIRFHLLNPGTLPETTINSSTTNANPTTTSPSSSSPPPVVYRYPPCDIQSILRLFIAFCRDGDNTNTILHLFIPPKDDHKPTLPTPPPISPLEITTLCLSHPSSIPCIITRALASQLLQQLTTFRLDNDLLIGSHQPSDSNPFSSTTSIALSFEQKHPPSKPARQPTSTPQQPPLSFADLSPLIIVPSMTPTTTPDWNSSTSAHLQPEPPESTSYPSKTSLDSSIFLQLVIGTLTLNIFDQSSPTLYTLPTHHLVSTSLRGLYRIYNSLTTLTGKRSGVNYDPIISNLSTHLTHLCLIHINSIFPLVRGICTDILIVLSIMTRNSPQQRPLTKSEPLAIISHWISTQLRLLHPTVHSNHDSQHLLFSIGTSISQSILNDNSSLHFLLWETPPPVAPSTIVNCDKQPHPPHQTLPKFNNIASNLFLFDHNNNTFGGNPHLELHYVRFILAIYLSFHKPGWRTCNATSTRSPIITSLFLHKPFSIPLTTTSKFRYGYLPTLFPTVPPHLLTMIHSLLVESSSTSTLSDTTATMTAMVNDQSQTQPTTTGTTTTTTTISISPFDLLTIGLTITPGTNHQYDGLPPFLLALSETLLLSLPTLFPTAIPQHQRQLALNWSLKLFTTPFIQMLKSTLSILTRYGVYTDQQSWHHHHFLQSVLPTLQLFIRQVSWKRPAITDQIIDIINSTTTSTATAPCPLDTNLINPSIRHPAPSSQQFQTLYEALLPTLWSRCETITTTQSTKHSTAPNPQLELLIKQLNRIVSQCTIFYRRKQEILQPTCYFHTAPAQPIE